MKTRSDTMISKVMLGYGLTFILPFVIFPRNFELTTFNTYWLCLWTALILYGLWKVEFYEITGNKLIKLNFMGWYKRTYDLDRLRRHSKEVLNTDYPTNPLNIIGILTKDKRYLIFRKIKLVFEENQKLTLDERTVIQEDFNDLYDRIKSYSKKIK